MGSSFDKTSSPDELWVVAVDGAQMRVFDCRRAPKRNEPERMDWALVPLPWMALKAEPLRAEALGHDKRGSIFATASSARHTVEPHVDAAEEAKNNFARVVAATLRRAYIGQKFKNLVLAAPPTMLGSIRKHIDPHIAGTIIAEIPKELTHCDARTLPAHIQEALP